MQNLWTPEDQRLPERLKYDIMTGPMFARPESYRRFYIKTDWSKDGMGEVILQVD